MIFVVSDLVSVNPVWVPHDELAYRIEKYRFVPSRACQVARLSNGRPEKSIFEIQSLAHSRSLCIQSYARFR